MILAPKSCRSINSEEVEVVFYNHVTTADTREARFGADRFAKIKAFLTNST